jgi:hypothetical protein
MDPTPRGDDAYARATELYREGNRLWRSRRFLDAIAAYEAARRRKPQATNILLNLGNAQLCLGRDAEGWANYQYREERRLSEARALGFPEWRGEPLDGKRLFIWAEQGWGDQIFAARWIRNLRAAHVALVADSRLVALLQELPVQVIPRVLPLAVGPDYDFWTLPLSLPQWAQPEAAPYLHASRPRSGGIGLMWRGKPRPDPNRSLPEAVARELLAEPDVISLQPEDTGATSFRDTADLIAGLDFVLSIDTSVAHLAGALGKPGIVLLHHGSHDWRWREGRPGVSDWYPSLRILRQSRPGDWDQLAMAMTQARAFAAS